MTPLLEGRGLRKAYQRERTWFGRPDDAVLAVDGVDVTVNSGETVGVVGESGSGKSTLGKLVGHLASLDEGKLLLAGRDVSAIRGKELRDFRRQVQTIFQDPFGSLDPTKSVASAVTEPLVVHGEIGRRDIPDRAEILLHEVGLDPVLARRRPDMLSGGQRQRVSIARALALSPQLIIADEPTSALDLSTRSEVLNLLLHVQRTRGLSFLLISHDFATIRHLAHRVMVMQAGKIVETGSTEQIVGDPQHPYSKSLLAAVPARLPPHRPLNVST